MKRKKKVNQEFIYSLISRVCVKNKKNKKKNKKKKIKKKELKKKNSKKINKSNQGI